MIITSKMIHLIFQVAVVASLSHVIFGATLNAFELNDTFDYSRSRITDDDYEDDSDICPNKNLKYPVLLPHPKDCNKFYICDRGTPHLKTCMPGLHFNTKAKVCDFPENAGCDNGITERPRGKLVGDGEDTDDGMCPSKNSRYPVLIPHPKDCSKFYICDRATPHLKTCMQGLHFNTKSKVCDFPENAGCDKGITERPRGKLVGDGEDTDDGMCPAKNSRYPVLIPHPKDCSKFYICDRGTPHLKTCMQGLHFNTKSKVCDFPGNAGCDKGVTKRPKGKMVGDIYADICPIKNPRYSILIPHPEDCTKYYLCDNGSPHLKKCQEGLHFNNKLKSCDYPDNAGCEKVIENAIKIQGGNVKDLESCSVTDGSPLLQPHPLNCALFYICHNGIRYLHSCPAGLHFNFIRQVCDFPEDAGCNENRTLLLSRNAVQQAPGVQSPFCPPLDGKIPIFYRSSSNCSVYYMCSHGLAYEFICPARLHFNLRRKMCDYEENAKCQIGFV